MSDRISETILLCEDEMQERFIKAYMKQCRLRTDPPNLLPIVASRMQVGGNVTWVMNEFPKQLHACRRRHTRAKTLLIVMVDADALSVDERSKMLIDRLKSEGYEEFGTNEPAVLLIPKRHIETWICALLGIKVTEDEDCKEHKRAKKEDIRQAAQELFDWSRDNASRGLTCVPSLQVALSAWRRIG